MYASLQEQFEATKKSLKSVEDNIRRITGREPDQFNLPGPGINKWKNGASFSGNLKSLPKKRPLNGGMLNARPTLEIEESIAIEEDSGDDDVPSKRPCLQSTIVAAQKDIKSRRDTIEEQKSDSRGMARNRRMLGMILGTLQKFQHEESRRKEQAQKRAEIDKKVEEAAEKEKEDMKKEKQDLFLSRREKQIQIRCLEKKIEIAEIHEIWESRQKLLKNFIRTKSQPELMFLPTKHNSSSQKRLKESQEKIEGTLLVFRANLEQELQEIDECYRKDSLQDDIPGDKENIGPIEEMEAQEIQMEENQQEENVCAVETDDALAEVDDRTQDTILETVADQGFEPIYDE